MFSTTQISYLYLYLFVSIVRIGLLVLVFVSRYATLGIR